MSSDVLRALLVEDSPADAILVTRELRRVGREIAVERVDEAVAMRAALAATKWDIIICDWSMPQFSAPGALEVLKESGLDIPFIIVSGTMGEEAAVEAMRAGARDYLLKDRLTRLAPVVERELRECAQRKVLRAAEQALRESENRFGRLAQSGLIGIAVNDASGNFSEANDAFLQMVGYSREDLQAGDVRLGPMTPRESSYHDLIATEQLRTKGVAVPWEKEYIRKDGTRIPVLVGAAALEETSAISFAIDLSAQKRTEAALRASEVRLRRLADSGIVGIAVVDLFGNTYEANEAYLSMIGYSREDLLAGQIDWMKMSPPEWRELDRRAVEQLKLAGSVAPWEKEYFRKDGSRVPVFHGVAMLEYPKCIVILADLTARKEAEAALMESANQLRHAQKMEAVGRLAGGVAHDFNNVLSVILSYGEILLDDIEPGDPMRDDVEEIRKAGKRAADLTRQLLMFSRQNVLDPKVLDLNDVLANMNKMLQRIVGEDVNLVSAPSKKSLGRVRVDPTSIEQVIMNLVVNARDAMPVGGELTIRAENVELDEAFARTHTNVKPGLHVMLAVSDNGIGMDAATRARIFEPFYTTKEKGKGTGLGLSTVFGIVQQSGGTIEVQSEIGKGAVFKIYLPCVHSALEPTRSQPPPATLRGVETILLVEDEEPVRAVVREILRRQGYRVIEARNGREALQICERSPETIDLLLTDVVMPQMSGAVLAKRLGESRPDTRVLCMSGYTDDSVFRHGVFESEVAFLQKPITPESLCRKIREVLDEPLRSKPRSGSSEN